MLRIQQRLKSLEDRIRPSEQVSISHLIRFIDREGACHRMLQISDEGMQWLDANGSPVEGWDGTFKGAPAPQGAYTWQASATFVNGSEWKGMSYNNSLPKRTGTVNLIR